MKIMDAHLHIFEHVTGYGSRGEFRSLGNGSVRWANGDCDRMYPEGFAKEGVTAEDMLRFMDENGIEKGVLLQASAYGFQNEFIAEAVNEYPDRLAGAATLDPFIYYFKDVLDRLTGELQFKIFKLEMSVGGGLCGYHDADALWSHPNLELLCRRLDAMGGTLALDLGAPQTASHRVFDVRKFAMKYPDLHIVVCHLLSMPAGCLPLLKQELMQLKLPNVWFDLAAIPSNTGEHAPFEDARAYIKAAKAIVGADKLIWGTDCATVLKDYSYDELKSVITETDLFTAAELTDVFYANAAAAYRI